LEDQIISDDELPPFIIDSMNRNLSIPDIAIEKNQALLEVIAITTQDITLTLTLTLIGGGVR